MKLRILSVFAIVSLLVSCADDRPQQFPQGQGQDLNAISDWDGREYDLNTGATLAKANVSSSQKIKGAANLAFDLVTYSTEAKLMGSLAFKGRPYHTYRIRYVLTDRDIRVLKIAPAEDIPVEERTLAETLADGRLAVPLVSYPVAYYNVEQIKNEDNEPTNTKSEIGSGRTEGVKSRSAYFKADFLARRIFEPVEKIDVFPANFFDGEWFYSETLVATQEKNADLIGRAFTSDQDLEESTRIRFSLSNSLARGLNVNIDERVSNKDDIQLNTAISIPVAWKEYEVTDDGTERTATKRNWSERPYVEVKFGEAITQTNDGSKNRVVDLEVEPNYISFTVERTLSVDSETESNARIRYSFLRAGKSSYTPRRAYKDDLRKFGFFTTEKSTFYTFERYRKEDFEKNTFISRFDPSKSKIVYHFTNSSPQWLRPAAKQAVEVWNDAFREAGTDMTVELDESFDVALGDLRYNSINIIESLTGSSLLGFGPSITDPYTGEIISATANLYVTPIREGIVDAIREYINESLGIYDDKYIYYPQPQGAEAGDSQADTAGSVMTGTFDRYELDPQSDAGYKVIPGKKLDLKALSKKKAKNLGREFTIGLSSHNLFKMIKEECPEVESYVAQLKAEKAMTNSNEIATLTTCSARILPKKMLGTLVHEMGHNFGLRHNFYGSTDAPNFWPKAKTGTSEDVRSSSVMEYTSFNEDRLVMPGPYDIAAIRFGYNESVQTADNSLVKIDTSKTLAENLKGKAIKPFKFCTDEDVMYGIDPMCQRHDAGLTPEEVTKNLLIEYNASMANLNYRYDRAWLNAKMPGLRQSATAAYRLQRFLIPMKTFYNEWRRIVSRYVGLENQYLEAYNIDSYKAVLQKMSKDPQVGPLFKLYFPAALTAYQLLSDVMFLPNRFCVLGDGTNPPTGVVELEYIRENVFHQTGVSVVSCADPAARKFVEVSYKSKIVGESGYSLNDVRYDMDQSKVNDPIDVVGTKLDRIYATNILANRSPVSFTEAAAGTFFPNFYDEPIFREELINRVLRRTLVGLDPSLFAITDENILLPKFKYERQNIMAMFSAISQGLMLPQKSAANNERMGLFYTVLTNDPAIIEQGKAVVGGFGGRKVVAFGEISTEIVKALEGVNDVLARTPVDASVFSVLKDIAKDAPLPTSDGSQKMNVRDFTEFIKSFMYKLRDLPKDQQQVVVQHVVQGVVGQTLQVGMSLAQQRKQLAAQPEDLEKFESQDVVEVFKVSKIPFELFKDQLDSQIEAYLKENATKVELQNRYRSDYGAQRDLLIQLLSSFAN